jgi:hypothetical protein
LNAWTGGFQDRRRQMSIRAGNPPQRFISTSAESIQVLPLNNCWRHDIINF